MSNLTGKTLGRYQILERIGQGGMAEVYKAYQPSLDRPVAIKVLHQFLSDTDGSSERFAREAKAVAGLRHPNIVQVIDFDTADTICFMVMEFVDGPTLKQLLDGAAATGTPLTLERVGEIITAVGNALGYAHRWGMVHRDVKPHNIMLTGNGQTLLTDFGIAKILSSATITDPSQISGTPAYMSPEQGRGATVDRRTDIYSLGIVLYELLTGRVPFSADTPFAVVIKHINEPLPPPRGINPAIPPGLERVVMKVTAKLPDERYQTADEFVKALQEAIAGAQADARAALLTMPAGGAQAANYGTPPLGVSAPSDTPPLLAAPAPRVLPPTVLPAHALPGTVSGNSLPPAAHITTPRSGPQVKDDSVTIRLASPEVIMTAGAAPVGNSAVIVNPSQAHESDQYNFELIDLDPTWYEMDVKSVMLWRGDSSQLSIRFTVPRRGTKAGIYTYRLRAQSVSDPNVVGYTTGRLCVSSPSTMQMTLQPPSQIATVGRYEVLLANGPVGGLIVDLAGSEPSGILEFTATPNKVRLGANEEARVTLTVQARAGAVGEAHPYPFTLIANLTGTDETLLPIECQAELLLQPEVDVQIAVQPEGVHWPLGDYRVVLTNPTSLTLDVDLQAEDPSKLLGIYFQGENEHLQLGRESTISVKAIARAANADLPTVAVHAPFVVRVHARNIAGPGEQDQTVECALDYEPPPVVEEADPLDYLTLELQPARAEGNPATINVRLVSSGAMPMLIILRGRDGGDKLEYTFEPPQIYLEAAQSEITRLTLRRQGVVDPEDQQPVAFEVLCGVAGAKGGRALTAAGEWVPPPPPPPVAVFSATIVPVEPQGFAGTYDVHLSSGSKVPLSLVLRGKDTSGLLDFKLEPPRISLPPGQERVVRVTVSTNALEPLSEEHTYPFEVICWVPSNNAMRILSGEFRYISF